MPAARLWIVFLALAPLLARGAAPELPAELLPRETLEKIYAAELPGYDPAQFQKLYDAHVYLEKYFRTDSAEDRRAITQILAKSGIPAATVGRMCRIHLAWPVLPPGAAYVNERIGPHDVQYFLGVPANYDRAKAWPLVVRLPAANAIITDPANPPKPDEVVRLYTQWVSDEIAAHPDALLVMPLLNLDELYGPSYKGMNTVVQAVQHVTTRANVDPRQVYLLGHGMAGHATWNLAIHYPTFFAAINPLAGGASADWQRVRFLNLRNTLPIVWHDSTDKLIPIGHSTALVGLLKNLKYDVVFEQTRNVGHAPPPEVVEKCYRAMRGRVRELYPKQVNLRSSRPDPSFNRVDWVQVHQPLSPGKENSFALRRGTGRITVHENAHTVQAVMTAANRVEAKTENVQTLRFFFNDQTADLSKPVTITVNGKTRFEGIAPVSLDELLGDQLFLGRGWRYFTAAVDVDLTANSSSRPTTARSVAPPPATATRLFFTADEGRTLVPLEVATKSPTLHGDKPAFRAHVFSCDGGKTQFVGYLSKSSPVSPELLVRKAGTTVWSPVGTAAAAIVLDVKCPEKGGAGPPVEVFPGK
jgi:pimeloyl-ACP methyl ester carboxylesterase